MVNVWRNHHSKHRLRAHDISINFQLAPFPQQSQKVSKASARRNLPPYSSLVEVMAASQSPQSTRSSQSNCLNSRPILNSTHCFWCGQFGHISSTCSYLRKPPPRSCSCGGIGHFIKFCLTRARQQSSQPAESKAKSTNAVASAGTGAPELFTETVIDGVRGCDALVDTGSAFSMLSSVLYEQLPSRPAINRFRSSAPDIVGVGGASAEVWGYVDAFCRSRESRSPIRCSSSMICNARC